MNTYEAAGCAGQSRLPSFFLPEGPLQRAATNVLPKPTEPVPHSRSVFDNRLSRKLERQHKRLSPSGIESFLQCPFQFLGRNTLRLDPLPPAPRDRATFLFQGGVIHKVLAEWMEQPILGSDIFDKVFEEACARAHLPGGYRTEAVRLEMLRNFQAFLEDRTLTLHWPARTELEFLVELEEGFSLKGQMDRIDIGPGRRALVIDYKYSAGNKVRERVEESEAGNLVQGGLYMLAARLKWGYEPIGMLYCGLKKPKIGRAHV